MTYKHIATLAGTFLSLAIFCAASRADDDRPTLVVGEPNTVCPNARYATISAAINAASAGDEIDICPALYTEQLTISKPLTLRGISENGVDRVLLRPPLGNGGGVTALAVITVAKTQNVTIENLAIDASNNSVTGCAGNPTGVISNSLAGIHFFNSSGSVKNNAIFGAQLPVPGCLALFPGNGFGVQVDSDGTSPGPFQVSVSRNSIHDFSRNGILAVGKAVKLEASDNAISGVGPTTGENQFGIFVALGAVGRVSGNIITQGLCGTIAQPFICFALRSEGVVLRSAGDGTIVDSNIITNVQFGLFLNGANKATIAHNVINNVSAVGSGMQLQSITNSLFEGNKISGVLPITQYPFPPGPAQEGCGINELSLTELSPGSIASAGNVFRDNTVNDAYCGIAHVTASTVESGSYFDTLYTTLNTDQFPGTTPFPPPIEP
jgi:hypothetical protein